MPVCQKLETALKFKVTAVLSLDCVGGAKQVAPVLYSQGKSIESGLSLCDPLLDLLLERRHILLDRCQRGPVPPLAEQKRIAEIV